MATSEKLPSTSNDTGICVEILTLNSPTLDNSMPCHRTEMLIIFKFLMKKLEPYLLIWWTKQSIHWNARLTTYLIMLRHWRKRILRFVDTWAMVRRAMWCAFKIHDRYSDGSTTRVNAGLINTGPICYTNAYLQAIASCPILPPCLKMPPNVSMQAYPLYYALTTVISSLVSGS
jgi:hypothetical protein